MLTSEQIRRIQHFKIKTKKLLRGRNTGLSATRRVGNGFEFDQLRDYQVGDNVRAIDWKSSARSNKLIVRSYREDRNRSIVLLVDISQSGNFGSSFQLKETVIRDIAALISCTAEQGRDGVGAVFFHQEVEKVIPVGTSKVHQAALMHDIFTMPSQGSETDISKGWAASLQYFGRDALVILISDCLSIHYQTLMRAVAQRHELMIVRVYDPVERALPHGFLVTCQDQESKGFVDATNPFQMASLRSFMEAWVKDQNLFFKQLGIAYCDINVHESYDIRLLNFFVQRCV